MIGACNMTDREHDQLLATATDRFERRLSEEIGAVRVTMVEQDSATRQKIATEIGGLRVEMCDRFAAARVHTEAQHRELIKWAFVFWVGQVAAVAGIVGAFS